MAKSITLYTTNGHQFYITDPETILDFLANSPPLWIKAMMVFGDQEVYVKADHIVSYTLLEDNDRNALSL